MLATTPVELGKGTGALYIPPPPGTFDIIACVDAHNGLSREGKIPWRGTVEARGDMPWFSDMTTGGVCIMGRKTYEDCGMLPNRTCLVVGSGEDQYSSLDDALAYAWLLEKRVWVIGGMRLYHDALLHPALRFVYVNKLIGDYKCDTHLPLYADDVNLTMIPHNIATYHLNVLGNMPASARIYATPCHVNMSELTYLTLVRELLAAPVKQNRTGVPTRSLFAQSLRFPLMRGADPILPLLTTKKMALRAIVTELLWFLNGDTTTEYLNTHGCKIWNDNATKEFLDGRGLPYPAGTLGPVYGWQWRNFNEDYTVTSDNGSKITSHACDQIAAAIHLLKTDPMSRRIVVSAWNPAQIQAMALPPCHFAFQFVCSHAEGVPTGTYTVNTCMHMRSADVGLGVPFNIASYALLTHIICAQCGPQYVPGELVITMADCHIYTNHMDGLSEQIGRWPRQYPKVSITHGTLRELYDLGPSCVKVEGYDPHPAISMRMVV